MNSKKKKNNMNFHQHLKWNMDIILPTNIPNPPSLCKGLLITKVMVQQMDELKLTIIMYDSNIDSIFEKKWQ